MATLSPQIINEVFKYSKFANGHVCLLLKVS